MAIFASLMEENAWDILAYIPAFQKTLKFLSMHISTSEPQTTLIFYPDKMEQEGAYRHTYLPYICHVKTSDFYSLLFFGSSLLVSNALLSI